MHPPSSLPSAADGTTDAGGYVLHLPADGRAIGSGPDPTPGLPTVSLIIPIWNDAEQLREVMSILAGVDNLKEVIVGDASDGPECRQIALAAGAKVVACPIPNRGRQMNAAASLASGDALMFHHADTEISAAHVDSLRRALTDPAVVGGAFYRKFDPTHQRRQWMTRWVRRANRKGTLYGDQSQFVRRDHFQRIGRFADLPMMEDIEFSKRLRRSARESGGRVEVIDPPMLSSARRHKAYGSWRATLENFGAVWLYKLGVSAHWIHRKYYRRGKKKQAGREGPPVETGRTVHQTVQAGAGQGPAAPAAVPATSSRAPT